MPGFGAWEWVILPFFFLLAVLFVAVIVSVGVIVAQLVRKSKESPTPRHSEPRAYGRMSQPLAMQLAEVDRLLVEGHISPPEHAAMRSQILGASQPLASAPFEARLR